MFSIHGSCVFTNSFRRENKIADPKSIYPNHNYNHGEFIRVDIELKTQNKQQVWWTQKEEKLFKISF